MTADRIEIWSVSWPEVGTGIDLAALVAETTDLRDGDIVVISSKVVSKAEGRIHDESRTDVVIVETRRVVARRAGTVIAQTRHGLVMAAAGVDASNVPDGRVLSLPDDPDHSARTMRTALRALGVNVAVVVTDTAGRAWRNGQTDLAIGCAGLAPLVDLHGSLDTEGNVLHVTAPAVADELAAATDLVKGKVSRRPLAVVRGLADHVLPAGDHGPGAVALVRESDSDLFGLGSREAVRAALGLETGSAAYFPRLVRDDLDPFDALTSARDDVELHIDTWGPPDHPDGWEVTVEVRGQDPRAHQELGRLSAQIDALCVAHRLEHAESRPGHDDVTAGLAKAGWRLTRA